MVKTKHVAIAGALLMLALALAWQPFNSPGPSTAKPSAPAPDASIAPPAQLPAQPTQPHLTESRPPAPPSTGTSLLRPFPQGLGAKVAAVLETRQADESTVIAARALNVCISLEHRYQQHAVLAEVLSGIKDGSKMLAEERAKLDAQHGDCQTVQGDPAKLRAQLLALAYAAEIPGAAAERVALREAELPEEAYRRVALDAWGGELGSIVNAVLDPSERFGLTDQDRLAMTYALQRVYRDPALRSEVTPAMLMLASHHWDRWKLNNPELADSVHQFKVDSSGLVLLPPELSEPADPTARQRIATHASKIEAEARKYLERAAALRARGRP